MSLFDPANPSDHAKAVLRLLRSHHNVIISGPPATGKSRLLAELRHCFKQRGRPAMVPNQRIPLPADKVVNDVAEWMPSPLRSDRRTWSITFHQGTKYRDLVSGLSPRIGKHDEENSAFMVTRGPLFEAAEHAKSAQGASLLEVDEVNRGPAVSIFGDTITALEGDKRLLSDGTEGDTTSTFRVLNDDGSFRDYALPYHLYIVAAMNEADTSVEPLDIAFLRRFVKYRLLVDESLLRDYFSLPTTAQPIPDTPRAVTDVFEVAVQAWATINDKIELARGSAFQLGHGIFMELPKAELPQDISLSLDLVAKVWERIYTHIEEVFFGDTRGMGAVLHAREEGTPYILEEREFADMPLIRLHAPKVIDRNNIYGILSSVSRENR